MMVAEEDRKASGTTKPSPSAQVAAAARSAARYAADQRALLFGSRLGKGPEAERRGQLEAQRLAALERHRAEEQALMEERNNELIGSLHDKVQELKEVVQETKEEVTTSAKVVELLHEGTDSVLSKLQWANGRVREIAKDPSWRYTVMMTVFCMLLLLFFYALAASGAMRRNPVASSTSKALTGFLSTTPGAGVTKKL